MAIDETCKALYMLLMRMLLPGSYAYWFKHSQNEMKLDFFKRTNHICASKLDFTLLLSCNSGCCNSSVSVRYTFGLGNDCFTFVSSLSLFLPLSYLQLLLWNILESWWSLGLAGSRGHIIYGVRWFHEILSRWNEWISQVSRDQGTTVQLLSKHYICSVYLKS